MVFYGKTDDDTWAAAKQHYAKSSTGWKLGYELYRKTGATTWVLEEDWDRTAPPAPTLVGMTMDSATRTVKITAKMPNTTDISHATLKFWLNGYPVTEAGDANIYPETGNRRYDVTPGQNVTWTFKPQYYDRLYYVSIWAVDDSGNASTFLKTTFKVPSPKTAPAPTSPSPTPTPVKLTYNASQSGSMERTGTYAGKWSSWAGDLVIQAGVPNFGGAWTYGTRIRSGVGSRKITKMTVRIQRVNSQHGVSTGANVYLIPHKLTEKGNALVNAASPVLVGTLTRGQTKTFTVPSAWWPYFASGTYKGLGLWTSSSSGTSWTSANYIQTYGRGTTSGQVYIEAQ